MNLLERIPKLCAALRDAGLAVSVREEVAVRDVLLALAASGESPKTAEDLRDALRPVLCRSQDQLRTYEDTFAEVFPNAVVAVGRGAGFASFQPPKLRRWQLPTVALWGWVIGVAVVLLIFGLDLWVWKNVFGPVLVSTHAEAPAAEPPNLLEPAPNIEVPLPVPIKPTEPAPVAAKSDNRWWIPYTLAKVCGLLSFLLHLLILRARNKHRYLNRRLLDAVEDAEDDVIFQVPIRSPFPEGLIRACALELRKHRDIDLLDHLDVPATVRASVRRGGWFTPMGRRFKRTPEYLILIQHLSGADHRGRLARYLAAQLRGEGVPVNVWTFRHEPDVLYAENDNGTADALSLEQLHVRMPDHRLLIFSEDSAFRTPQSALGLWEQGGAWFADRHPDLAALPGALLAAPAGAEGLAAYTALLRGERVSLRAVAPGRGRGGREELPVLLTTDRERWTDVRPPSAGTVAAGLQVLEEYLGAGGLFWLRACAAYPELDWNLTVALGRELDARIAQSARPDLLNRLIALPWFQEGAMPQWLRRALLRPLRGPERKEIHRALNRILVEGAAEVTGDSAIRNEVHQLIAKNPSLIDRLARKLKRREPGAGWKERTVVETFGGDGAVRIPVPDPDRRSVLVPPWVVAVTLLTLGGLILYVVMGIREQESRKWVLAETIRLRAEALSLEAEMVREAKPKSVHSTGFVEQPGTISQNQPQTTVSREKPFTNTLGMQFVPVPGTNALFCIWETRVQDYAAFAKENPKIDMQWKDYEYMGNKQGPDHPVINVSWEDAQAFCKWLSAKEGRTYRLPKDREWSVAVGLDTEPSGGTPEEKDGKIADVYPWGTGFPPPPGAGNYSGQENKVFVDGWRVIEGYTDNYPFTAPVASYTPNKFGLYDMGGNVWEWCEDNYSPNTFSHVSRGASWLGGASSSIQWSSLRRAGASSRRGEDRGFRVVMDVGSGH